MENLRMICVTPICIMSSFITPNIGYIWALILMFSFNIWAGMRADGISITRCRNFNFGKFKNALVELFLYLCIVLTVFTVMKHCGDEKEGMIVAKSLTYVFLYVYLQNAFRNLVIAYPRIAALRMIYHIIRFEIVRALPSHIQPIIERYELQHGTEEDTDNR